eukprot:scaffold189244_cov22-Tisochrysis_lutea.AAC.3
MADPRSLFVHIMSLQHALVCAQDTINTLQQLSLGRSNEFSQQEQFQQQVQIAQKQQQLQAQNAALQASPKAVKDHCSSSAQSLLAPTALRPQTLHSAITCPC